MQKFKNFYSQHSLKMWSAILGLLLIFEVINHLTPAEVELTVPVDTSSTIESQQDSKRPSMIIELPPLDEFVEMVFDECGGKKMSTAMRAVRKAQLLRMVESHPKMKGMLQYDYIAVPCIETAMGSIGSQVSSAGALGFAQLMPATAREEAKIMGLGDIKDSDLQDAELNMTISVNHYARLVDVVGAECAAAAYNGGSAASAVKDCKSLRPIKNNETAGYVSVAYVIMRKHMREVVKETKPKVKETKTETKTEVKPL